MKCLHALPAGLLVLATESNTSCRHEWLACCLGICVYACARMCVHVVTDACRLKCIKSLSILDAHIACNKMQSKENEADHEGNKPKDASNKNVVEKLEHLAAMCCILFVI